MAARERRAPCRAARRGGCARRPARRTRPGGRPPSPRARGRDSARRSRRRRGPRPRRVPRPAGGCAPARRRSPDAARNLRSLPRRARSARDRRRSTPRGGRARRGRRTSRPPPRPARAPWSATGSSDRRPRAGDVRSAGRGSGSIRPASRYAGPSSCIASVAKPAAPSRQPCATHGCAAALGEVLPAHHHRTAARMPGDMVVDVLRRIGLVAHDEAARRRGRRPARGSRRTATGSAPALATSTRHSQSSALRVQPERDGVPHAARPRPPRRSDPSAAPKRRCAGADGFHDARPRRSEPQEEAADPAAERRAVDLVDQRPAALVLVLDREHASVRQDADRQARAVGDAAQAEIALARRLEGAEGRHLGSLVSWQGGGQRPTIGATRADW